MPFRSSTRPPTRPPTRPGSPSRDRERHTVPPPLPDDSFSSALHAALNTAASSSTSSAVQPSAPPDDMFPRDKPDRHHSHIEIALAQDVLTLKGTGVDVDPAVLSGNLVLHLHEPMSLREINLQFRGKARVPSTASEPLSLNSSQQTYVVCNHEWSFLEGAKSHSHTLKAGRHFFPFSVEIAGSLPSSLFTAVLGGANVAYKLRATAVRPGLAHNLHAVLPVTVLRSFGPEALEYQQTLEIENTWPEKLMYAIMLPHKAWAVGDRVSALMKFEPLAKGAKVLSVATSVHETVKLAGKVGQAQESTRAVVSVRHEIVAGKAVLVEETGAHKYRTPLIPGSSLRQSPDHTPSASGSAASTAGYFTTLPSSPARHSGDHSSSSATHSPPVPPPQQPVASGTSAGDNASSSDDAVAGPGPSTSTARAGTDSPPRPMLAGAQDLELPDDIEPSLDEIVTVFSIPLPALSLTPTHGIEPVLISHRIRWSILIGNLDGHTSELRCSLPLHVLDARLLDESRAATAATRRLLLGEHEAGPAGADAEADLALPSYTAHVHDRVANMYVPEAATVRVSTSGSGPRTPSGVASPDPGRAGTPGAHLPPAPGPDGAAPLEWVNSELLLSLSEQERRARRSGGGDSVSASHSGAPTGAHTTPPDSGSASHSGSARASRRGSRAPSPERSAAAASQTHSHHGSAPGTPSGSSTVDSTTSSAGRGSHGIFHVSMKPFTSLASSFSRAHSHSSLSHHFGVHHSPQSSPTPHTPGHHHHSPSATSGFSASVPGTPGASSSSSTVPDYESAARGFLGGVPPLSSMSGLPSYEETEARYHPTRHSPASSGTPERRSTSDADLAGSLARQATISTSAH